jgi:hypothetical protein
MLPLRERANLMRTTPVSTAVMEAHGLIGAFADGDVDEIAFRAHLIAGHAAVAGQADIARCAVLVGASAGKVFDPANDALPAAIAQLMEAMHAAVAAVG